MELNKDAKDLYVIIRRFENKKWLKMATDLDLAKEITEKWCSPTALKSHYDGCVLQIIKKIKDNINREDGSLDGDIVDDILLDLTYIIMGKETETDEN